MNAIEKAAREAGWTESAGQIYRSLSNPLPDEPSAEYANDWEDACFRDRILVTQLVSGDWFDDANVYLPAYVLGPKWNGFLQPYFTLETAKVLQQFMPELVYDAGNDSFRLKNPEDPEEVWSAVDMQTVDGKQHLYAIGAGFWTWEPAVPNLVVDGLDGQANFAGDGQFPPFAVFDVDRQENVAGPFASRELADAHRLEILAGRTPLLDPAAMSAALDKAERGQSGSDVASIEAPGSRARFLVPMFLVVRADDVDSAEEIAGKLQARLMAERHAFLYQDEALPTVLVSGDADREFHSMLDEPAILEAVRQR